MNTRACLLAIAAASALALAPGLPAAPGFAAALLVLGFGIGWMVARRVEPSAEPLWCVLLALTLSPALAGGAGTLLELAGISAAWSARALLVVCGGWALLESRAAQGPLGSDPTPRARLIVPALLWMLVVAAFLLGNPYLPPRSDGWFHAAVVERIAQLGLPPEDPFFAGIRLLYFWGYHVWAGLFLALQPGLSPFAPLVAFNLVAAASVMLALGLLVHRLTGELRLVALTCALAALGYYPGAWAWIVVRCFTGDVRGMAELSRQVTHGVTDALQTMHEGTMHSSMVTFADKFLVLTPFSMAQALFVVFLIAFLRFVERPTVRAGLMLGLVQTAALFIHTVGGWAQALCAALWWCWAAVRARRDPEARRRLIPVAAVFLLATVLMVPYLWVTTHGKSGAVSLRFTPIALSSLILAGWVYLVGALPVLRRRERDGARGVDLVPMASALVLAALFIRLPENNQSKFLNMLFLLLAAPAAVGWCARWARLRPRGRAILATLALVAIGPTTALVAWGFASERGQTFDAVPMSTRAEREAFTWARAHTDARAAFADQGGGEDLVVRAARGSLWGGHGYEDNWGYPMRAMRLRERAVDQLSTGADPDTSAAALLRALDRPVVVVARRRYADKPGAAWNATLAPPRYRALYANDEVRLYQWVVTP